MAVLSKLSISIIIPVHNGGDSFCQCLSSVSKIVAQPDELIVVADADTDGSWLVAEKFGAKVIRLPVNRGPATARNLGANAATGDILFFIDADVTISKNALSQVRNAFETDTELAALIGSYDDAPGANNFLSQYKNLLHHYTHQMGSSEAFTFWGACGVVRRNIFLSVGGFNENYRRPSIEDIELGYRFINAGYKIKLLKDLQVKHLKRWGVISLLKAELFYRAIPWTELIWDRRQLNNDLNLGVSSRGSIVAVFIFLSALIMAFWRLEFVILAAVACLSLLWLNFAVYQFFYAKRGLGFTLRVIPWHWFYFFYGGLAFAWGTGTYWINEWLSLNVDTSTDLS